jgi:broad specificity phosphatase PhoE
MTKEPILYLVRHGATLGDDTYSGPPNPPLTEQGRNDAAEVAQFFVGRKTGDIVSSELGRTQATANEIGKALGKKVQLSKGLDSLDVGDVSKIKDKDEADKVIHHHQDNPDEPIPGGESINHFDRRIEPELMKGIGTYYKTGLPSIFSIHHSVQHTAGKIFNNDKDSALTHPGGVVAVYKDSNGFRAVPIFKPE